MRLSNRTKKYAKNLNYQGHRHPVIRAILIIFEILSDYESRKKEGEDADRFIYTLGFNQKDVEMITEKSSRCFRGRGHFNSDNTLELCSLIGLNNKHSEIFNEYDIIWDIFSSKGKSTDDIFDNLYGLSKEGKELLKQMARFLMINKIKLYYRYFKTAETAEAKLSFIMNR